MRKLKLDLDAIQVDSFELHAEPPARGTVHGQNSVQGWASYCGFCTWDDPEGDSPPAETMMEYATCGGGYSCLADVCG
jgi:hypothetical protein